MPYASANGIRLYYEVDGSGEPLVQIHGSGWGRDNFESITPILAQSFEVLNYDMRGFGFSDAPPGPYSMELWAEDLAALLDALKYSSINVHGTSMGALVALTFAAQFPDRVRKLILTSPFAAYDLAARMNRGVSRSLAEAYGWGNELFDHFTVQVFTRAFIDRQGADATRDLVRKLTDSGAASSARASISLAVEHADLRKGLSAVRAPTRVIGATHDILTPVAMGPSGMGSRSLAAALPDAEFIEVDSGHAFLFELPLETASLLRDFLVGPFVSTSKRAYS